MQNYFSNDSNKFYEVMLYNNICPPSMQCLSIVFLFVVLSCYTLLVHVFL